MPSRKKQNTAGMPWDGSDPNLPNPQIDVKKWLEVTDTLCKQRFDPSRPLPPDLYRGQPESVFAGSMTEDALQEIVGARRINCASHLRLSLNATKLFTEHDFEEKWLAFGEAGQERYLLNAFRKQEAGPSENLPMCGPDKLNCPELCRDQLLKDGGKGFLDLMKAFLLDNNDQQPTKPFVLPSARFDAIIGWKDVEGKPNKKVWLEMRRITRTSRIATFCGYVMAEYTGHSVEVVSYTHEHRKTKNTLADIKPLVQETIGAAESKKWVKEQVATRKEMKLFCDNCLMPEDKTVGKMPVCTRCKAIGREVRYCSKECQRGAWKSHKSGCGRKLGINSASEDVHPIDRGYTIISRIDIPPVVPGYRRSPDLLRLIRILNDLPLKDYVLVIPGPDLTNPELETFSLDELHGAAVFIIMRNRAMCSGDVSALFYVYRVLQTLESTIGGAEVLKKQLRKEYGKSFDDLMNGLDNGSRPATPVVLAEDVDKALGFLKHLGRFQEELADYEPGYAGKKTMPMGIEVGPKKDLTIIVMWPDNGTQPLASVLPLPSAKQNPLSGKTTKGQEPIGPNHPSSIPPPREDYERSVPLEKQIKLLAENPTADYILWGIEDLPGTPHKVEFVQLKNCIAFLCYRRRLFMRGAFDIDALAYLIMALELAVGPRKISRETMCAQLGREYGQDYVNWALDSIKGKKYHRRDGKIFDIGEIPASTEDFAGIPQQLKATERFYGLLKDLRV